MPIELANFSEMLFGARAGAGAAATALPVDLLLDRDIDPDPRPAGTAAGVDAGALDRAIDRAKDWLISRQKSKGEWCFELESNIQIEAQTILTLFYVGVAEAHRERIARLCRYMERAQREDGGFRLCDQAASDVSITVQAYFAAKLAGVSPDAPWMARARAFVRESGGVEKVSVITKIYLALFGEYDWDGIPAMPVSVMHMPRGTAFNIYEMAYWARTCVIPLLVLYSQKRIFETPVHARIDELYVTPREKLRRGGGAPKVPTLSWRNFFVQADRAIKAFERLNVKSPLHDQAVKLAETWILEHQDQDGAWGGIFPAMTHSVMALFTLGHPVHEGPVARGLQAIFDLEVHVGDATWVQPCVSPVWDTAWTVIALAKAGLDRDDPALRRATDWLYAMQIQKPGDWSQKCPTLVPGGWAFQYHNDFYPDTDDSAVVLMALLNTHYRDDAAKKAAFDRGIGWLLGLQNGDGGWGAFERDVDNEIYNEILFNDAKNMLDPSTVDVSGRCVEVLGKLGYPRTHPALKKAVRYLLSEQEPCGRFWGRWGVNYVYGTWSALCGLAAAKVPHEAAPIQKAADWLEQVQRPDGGFGEACTSYKTFEPTPAPSCPSQTAWGLMGLLAAGRAASESARRAAQWLIDHQGADGIWSEESFTGTGFPNVFYLRYDGYARYFPLLALARYREALA